MKVKYLKLKNWLLVTLMGALGLSGCHCHKKAVKTEQLEPEAPAVQDRGEMKLMYGVPTMYFDVRGQVKDSWGRPLKNVRVNMLERNMVTNAEGELVGDPKAVERWLDQTDERTDSKGRFELKREDLPLEKVRLLVRDVDGKENGGEFKNRIIVLPVTSEDLDKTGSNQWFQGTFNKEVKVKLERK